MASRTASTSRSASPSDRALLSNNVRNQYAVETTSPPRFHSRALQHGSEERQHVYDSTPSRDRDIAAGDDQMARHDRSRLPPFVMPRTERDDWQTLPPLGARPPNTVRGSESQPDLPSWASTGRMPPPRLSRSNDSPHAPRTFGVPSDHRPTSSRPPLVTPQETSHAHAFSGARERSEREMAEREYNTRPPMAGLSADYPPPPRRQSRSRSNSLRRASSTDAYYGEPHPAVHQELLTPVGPMDDDQRTRSGYWDGGNHARQDPSVRSTPFARSWDRRPSQGHVEGPPARPAPHILPPLSSLTNYLGPSPGHSASHPPPVPPPAAPLPTRVMQRSPVKRLAGSNQRSWADLTHGERRDCIHRVLERYMRARAMKFRRSPTSQAQGSAEGDRPEDDFFVTITCSHSGVAQKSYGHEKRFLCPPPIVRIRGPGFTKPAATPDGIRHLRMSILPGGTEGAHSLPPSEAMNQVVSEDVTLDRSLHAKFGHLHVGSSTSNAKTFKLQLDMIKTLTLHSSPASSERRYKSPRLSGGSDAYYGDPRLEPTAGPRVGGGPGLVPPHHHAQHSMMLRQHNWLTCESDAINVISKPSKKTTKAKTSSSQITPHLAICLFNRVNSQNVRTKYMAVDDGQLSARNDSWTTFFMRPLNLVGHADQRSTEAVTYGSVIVLEVPGHGAVSDPLVVCKVEKGRIVVPSAFADEVGSSSSGSMHPPPPQNDASDGPISQMQKVAFMRYEPPRRRMGHPLSSQQRAPRSFLCSAPPDPWWRPMGTPTDVPSGLHQAQHGLVTAPMRPVSSLSQRPDLSSPFYPNTPSGAGAADSHQPWMQRRSSSSSPLGPGVSDGRNDFGNNNNSNNEPSVLRSSASARPGMGGGGVEPLAPSPLTFLPAGRDDTRSSGISVKDQDVADDAFCWSVVGAAHFEYSFMRVGNTVEAEEMAPPTDTPVGCLPRLLSCPQYSSETHSLRMRGENLFDASSPASVRTGSLALSFEVWLGGFGPLHTEAISPPVARGGAPLPLVVSVRLPGIGEMVNYAAAVEPNTEASDRHRVQRLPPAPTPPHLARLPILLVRESDGLVCQSSYFVELFQGTNLDGHPGGYGPDEYGDPRRQQYRSGEWRLRIVN